jgi:hypothetical protein
MSWIHAWAVRAEATVYRFGTWVDQVRFGTRVDQVWHQHITEGSHQKNVDFPLPVMEAWKNAREVGMEWTSTFFFCKKDFNI